MKSYQKNLKKINALRNQYNPLRGITMQRVVSYLEAGERGEYRDLQWLYRMIEKRDAVLRALIRRRSAALQKLDWDIKMVPEDKLPPGFTVAQSEAQAVALRTLYDGIKNLSQAIKALALAEFRGYAHLEKTFKGNTSASPDSITSLELIDQWYWCRDGINGEWKFDPELRGSHAAAEEVEDPSSIITREVADPINEIAVIAFLRKNLSQKDWDGFVEVFGIPDIFFIMPAGMSAPEQDAWLATAEQLAGDGRGAIPNGGDVKAVGGDVRGTNPFAEHLNYQDTMIVLAGTSGKLTMLSDPTGIGGGATDAHENTFDELAEAEAAEISEILRNNLDKPLLAAMFEGQPALAYFELAAENAEDTKALVDNVKTLNDAGIDFDVEELAERTGYALSRKEIVAPQLKNSVTKKPLNVPAGTSRELFKNARKAIAVSIAADLQPIAASLADLLDATPNDLLVDELQRWQAETLPSLAETALEDPAAATAWADSLTAALFNGVDQ